MTYILADLPYAYDALEPYIDEKTMKIHHQKHYRSYLENFLKAIKNTKLENQSFESIFQNISQHPDSVKNNGGGFYNHTIFWKSMAPGGVKIHQGELHDKLVKYFGTFDKFKEEFSMSAASRFGSGWAWLIKRKDNELVVTSTPNQENPLMDITKIMGTPLLCLDVWEHAYYLKYQNRRTDYIDAFWNVVNWEEVEKRYKSKV